MQAVLWACDQARFQGMTALGLGETLHPVNVVTDSSFNPLSPRYKGGDFWARIRMRARESTGTTAGCSRSWCQPRDSGAATYHSPEITGVSS